MIYHSHTPPRGGTPQHSWQKATPKTPPSCFLYYWPPSIAHHSPQHDNRPPLAQQQPPSQLTKNPQTLICFFPWSGCHSPIPSFKIAFWNYTTSEPWSQSLLPASKFAQNLRKNTKFSSPSSLSRASALSLCVCLSLLRQLFGRQGCQAGSRTVTFLTTLFFFFLNLFKLGWHDIWD